MSPYKTIIPVQDLIVKWEQIDLNYRPLRYQHIALPLSYAPIRRMLDLNQRMHLEYIGGLAIPCIKPNSANPPQES